MSYRNMHLEPEWGLEV